MKGIPEGSWQIVEVFYTKLPDEMTWNKKWGPHPFDTAAENHFFGDAAAMNTHMAGCKLDPKTGEWKQVRSYTTCDRCGSAISNVAVVEREGKYLLVGMECASSLVSSYAVKKAQKDLDRQRATAGWINDDPTRIEVLSHVRQYAEGNGFYTSLLDGFKKYGTLTTGQERAVRRNMVSGADAERRERLEAEKATATNVPKTDGRVRISGEIVSAKLRPSSSSTTYFTYCDVKIVVRDDRGFKVWGTLTETCFNQAISPKNPSLAATEFVEQLAGLHVAFNARISVSERDPTFGFFKRPTKCEIGATYDEETLKLVKAA